MPVNTNTLRSIAVTRYRDNTNQEIDASDLRAGIVTVADVIDDTVKAMSDALYAELGAIATGLRPAGDWDATSASFPEGAVRGTYYFVNGAGVVDGQTFSIGDWLVPLINGASASSFTGQWTRGDYSQVVGPVTARLDMNLRITRASAAALETDVTLSGDDTSAEYVGVGDQVVAGRHLYERAEDTFETPHQTSASGLKFRYIADRGEVDVTALRSAEDGGDMAKTVRRAAASFPGHVLRVPPGNYSVASILEFGDLSDTVIRADGVRFTVEEDIVFARAAAPVFEEIQSISPIAAGDYWGVRRQITCTDGTAYAVGDVVKVVADNKMESTRSADGALDYRMGFMARVEAIVGDVITLDRPIPIDWAFTDNPRIGRLPRRRLDWQGGVISYEAGHDADWHGYAMLLYGMSDVRVQVEIERTYNAAVRALGCFEPTLYAKGRDLLNNEENLQYGYLIEDSSQGARVRAMAGRNRHGYTTAQAAIAANSPDLLGYGPACFGHVTGQSHGNSQAGFDTHHGSYRMNFHDIFMSGGTDGGGQLVLRGIGHRVTNCFGINGKNGIYVYTETETGVVDPTRDISIINPHIDVDDKALRVEGAFAEVHGGTLRSRKYGQAYRVANGLLTFKGHVTLQPGGPAEMDNRRMIEMVDGEIDARGAEIKVDLSDIPSGATEYGIINLGGDGGSRLKGGTWRIVEDAGLKAFLYKSGAGAHEAGSGLKVLTDKLGANPASSMEVTGAASSIYTSGWSWEHSGGDGNTAHIVRTLTTDGYELPLHYRADKKVFVKLYAGGANRTLGDLPVAGPVGQTLMIVNADATRTITIPNGAAYNTALPGAVDVILSYGQALALTFDGTLWWASA